MTTALILLILFAIGLPLWAASRDAHAAATRIAQQTCARNGVQLLDQTVALRSLRPRRDDSGRMRWQRTYQYAYSTQGHDRAMGEFALLGDELLWIREP